eukprot:1212411-Pleurochrysis_carterae.AAC.5
MGACGLSYGSNCVQLVLRSQVEGARASMAVRAHARAPPPRPDTHDLPHCISVALHGESTAS